MKHPSRVIVVAALALAIGWAIAPRAALPLYDGIGFPDEPYRFVDAPRGAPDTAAPTTAHGSAAVSGGQAQQLTANSAEQAPQVSVQIPSGRLTLPGSTTAVNLTAKPVASLRTAHGQYLWSDVYEVTVSPTARLRTGGLQATITLRAATAQRPQPKIAHYADGHWTLLPTFATGRDIYIAELTEFGRFAVIGTKPLDVSQLQGSAANGSGGSNKPGLFIGIGALVVVVGLFFLGRWRRDRARAVADEEEYEDEDEVAG
ncbi:MAG TPA: hypothetical protein VE442_09095 [Jatrophihabitans sp.]|nr:hypothetical protein [Jatrophihabitans sp.]